eukprot:SAG11_NODE_5550_length_1528_cov_1.402379_2_plen_65_part_00
MDGVKPDKSTTVEADPEPKTAAEAPERFGPANTATIMQVNGAGDATRGTDTDQIECVHGAVPSM